MTRQALRPLCAALPLFLIALATGCVGFITDDGDSDDEIGDTGDTDGESGTTGETGTDTGTTTGAEETTIYDIQQGNVAENANVTITGVVVTSPVAVDPDSGGGTAFVEEPDAGPYSGISLYMWTETVAGANLQPGDVVDITGEYAEFFGVSQLVVKNPGDITVVSSGEALPGPDLVDAADVARMNADAEPWEGVRVQVDNATILEANDGFGQYVLVGDALVSHLFVELPSVQSGGSFASVTGPLHFTFDEWKIEPTEAGDLAGYMDAPEPEEATPIFDIQMGDVAEGTYVKLEGVVATSGFTWSDDTDASFFVQEPVGGQYSGIQIHVADTTGLDVAPGDELTIVGTYTEFFDMSQIAVGDASTITVTGGGSAPSPEVVDPADVATGGSLAEAYEGVLISVENVVVTDENPDAPDEFNEFAVTGGLRIDDVFFAMGDWTKPALDTAFSAITGPLIYSFSNTKLVPRDNADLAQ